jgi:hypothetical protein
VSISKTDQIHYFWEIDSSDENIDYVDNFIDDDVYNVIPAKGNRHAYSLGRDDERWTGIFYQMKFNKY